MKVLMMLIFLFQTLVSGGNNGQSQTVPELNEQLALELRAEGQTRSSNFIDGGIGCKPEEPQVPVDQEGHVYFCPDLDTYDKMYEYLEATFTHEQAKNLIESVVIEIDGKLAYQMVGWGSMLDWSRAKGVIASKDDTAITYKFMMPTFGEESMEYEAQVEYRYVAGQGWKINSPARGLR